MRAGVADNLQPFFILGGDDLQRCVLLNQITCINQTAVNLAGDSRLGQAGTDGLGYVCDGNCMIKGTLTAVREGNNGHGATPAQW